MKYFYSILIITLLISCGKKTDSLTINPNSNLTINGIEFDDSNVSVWPNTGTVDAKTYYMPFDTTLVPYYITWSIAALYPEGDSVRFDWPQSPASNMGFFKEEKTWIGQQQKWLSKSTYLYIPFSSLTIPFKATATFIKSNKTVTRQSTLTVNYKDYHYDIFRINYGMSKDEVKANEIQRLNLGNMGTNVWYEPSPTVGMLFKSSNFYTQGYTIYEFADNKLKSVTETDIQENVSESMRRLIVRLTLPQPPNVGPLTKSYTWTYENLKCTLQLKDVNVSGTIKKLVCITYEKL